MLISRRAVTEYLDRDLDDFRWMKQLNRGQLEREFRALRVPPRFKTEPWLHQLVCTYIGIHHPRFLFLLDMGAGKTYILAAIIEHALRSGKLDHALVTVPRLFNIASWRDDLARHSSLEPWTVEAEDTEEKWELLLKPRGEATIIDMHGLMLAVCKKEKRPNRKPRLVPDDKRIKALLKRYNLLAVDEIHKLANHENLWFWAVDRLSRGMDFAYGATGTVFGKRVEDAWSEFYLIDRGETFGENLGPFRAAFFDTKMMPFKGMTYAFRKDRDEELHRMLQHRSLRYEETEMTDLPPLAKRELQFDMADEQKEHYLRALEGLINAGGNLRELEAQWLRMRQIVSGYLAWKDDAGDHVLRFRKNPKLDGLEALVDERGDSKIVVCYDYTETGRMIVERVKSMGVGVEWLWGGVPNKDKLALRERFLHDPARHVLVMNTATGGTGTDGLQGVARYMVFYESPPNPTDRKQAEKRIHRPGQERRSCVWDLVMRRSVDRGILDQIKEGIDVHDAVVNGRRKGRGFYLGG